MKLPRLSKLCLRRAARSAYELPGLLLEIKMRTRRRPLVMQDQFGFRSWFHPADPRGVVKLNWKRKTFTDSIGVIRFVLNRATPGGTCVDIGASSGAVSLPMWSKCGPSGKVVSVEADVSKLPRLRANLKLNGYPDEFVVGAAISDTAETRTLRCFPDAPGWNTFGSPQCAQDRESFLVEVQCIDFSMLLNYQRITAVDMVKIDTEGAELLVLRGMLPYLNAGRIKCVIFEVNAQMLPGMGATAGELLSLWEGLPYRLHRLTDDGTLAPVPKPWPEGLVGDCVALLEEDACT